MNVSTLYYKWKGSLNDGSGGDSKKNKENVCHGCQLLIPTRMHEMSKRLYCPGCFGRKFGGLDWQGLNGGGKSEAKEHRRRKLDDSSFRLLPDAFLPAIVESSCMSILPGGGVSGGDASRMTTKHAKYHLWYQEDGPDGGKLV